MIFTPTAINGVFVIDAEPYEDSRGFFARTFSRKEFEARGLRREFVLSALSWNPQKGTVRGMHLQAAPFAEAKLIRCARGKIFDVALDLRPGSTTFSQWVGVELAATPPRMMYIPEGCAHGFETLEPETEVEYQISEEYDAESARGVRWNDPAFGIRWPITENVTISERDAGYPDSQFPRTSRLDGSVR